MTKDEVLKLALEALEKIAMAGMSPSPEMSDGHINAWRARQAWRFIGIAARALDPIKEALAQQEQKWVYGTPLLDAMNKEYVALDRNFCQRCGKRRGGNVNYIHTCTPPNK